LIVAASLDKKRKEEKFCRGKGQRKGKKGSGKVSALRVFIFR